MIGRIYWTSNESITFNHWTTDYGNYYLCGVRNSTDQQWIRDRVMIMLLKKGSNIYRVKNNLISNNGSKANERNEIWDTK